MSFISTKIVCLSVKFGYSFVMKGRGAYIIYILGISACYGIPIEAKLSGGLR